MSEFPEWVERELGLCDVSLDEAHRIHRALATGAWRDPRQRRVWWRDWWPWNRRKQACL